METSKLYKVTLKGMTYSSTGVIDGVSYIIADNPHQAYTKVRTHLDEKDIGFRKDRELHSIELLAESYNYTDTNHILYL